MKRLVAPTCTRSVYEERETWLGSNLPREAKPALTDNNLQPYTPMLSYALIFLIVAILAGILGFGVIAGTAATIAKICFVVFLVLFLFSLLGGRRRL